MTFFQVKISIKNSIDIFATFHAVFTNNVLSKNFLIATVACSLCHWGIVLFLLFGNYAA